MDEISNDDVARLRAFLINPRHDHVAERVYLDLTDMPESAARTLARLAAIFRLSPTLPAILDATVDATLKIVSDAARGTN